MNDPATLLSSSFPRTTTQSYFHYVMKNVLKESSFSSKQLTDMIARCTLADKVSPLERKSDYDWTPLHVAAICGNKAGISYLLARGVFCDAVDKWGKTPMNYCQELHPELVHLLRAPQHAQPANSKEYYENDRVLLKTEIMVPLLEKWVVPLSQSACCYQEHSHDFGIEINKLLFLAPSSHIKKKDESSPVEIKHLAENIKGVADEEGFEVDFTIQQYCPRDHLLMLCDGTRLSPSDSENIQTAIHKNESFCCLTQNKAAYTTDQDLFRGYMGSVDKRCGAPEDDLMKHFGYTDKTLPRLKFYLEGGNHFLVTDPQGRMKLMVGADSLKIAHLHLRLDKFFNDPLIDVKKIMTQIESKVSLATLRETLNEMYMVGLLKKTPKTPKGLVSHEDFPSICKSVLKSSKLNPSEAFPEGLSAEVAEELELYKPMNLSDKEVLGSKNIAVKFLAEREITLELIGKSFGVEEGCVVSIPQAGYHIDTFMRSGPNRSFLIQNYQLCWELLDKIEINAVALGLSQNDLEILRNYKQVAAKLHKQIGPLTTAATAAVTQAGFVAIPSPGIILQPSSTTIASRYLEKNMNFLNAISGWSSKNQRYFYIATGVTAGDKLGSLLMESYRQFMQAYVPNLEVHYIGYDPKDPKNFAEGMAWWCGDAQAGPHCFSAELKTKSHTG